MSCNGIELLRGIHLAIVLVVFLLGACRDQDALPAPPKATSVPEFQSRNSTVVVPFDLSLDELQRTLESRTPRQLWSIDKSHVKCLKGQRVKVLGERLKVTPDIDCRIVGEVTRGRVHLSGSGQRLTITIPINAVIRARDVGGVLKGETATGSASVRADVTFGLDRDWQANARVHISYDWTDPPGIDFLGQRIGFASKADEELAKVIAGLEREIQKEVRKAKIKPALEEIWAEGFTNIRLSRRNPPAWLRITPSGMGLSGYSVTGRKVTLTIAVLAMTETFVGDEPPEPEPVPLPPQIADMRDDGLNFFMPVVADYAQLEPPLLKALRKLANKGIELDRVGAVKATFNNVTIYATENNRLAVGIDAEVEPVDIGLGKSKGRVWLTATAISEPDSQVVRIRDLQIYGDTDSMTTDLLLLLASSDSVRQRIAESIEEDFTKDYDKVLGKARRAVAHHQEGRLVLSAQIDQVHHDVVQVTGAGLFTPVVVSGKGQIELAPTNHGS